MPDLSRFAAFASPAKAVPPVPQSLPARGTARGTAISQQRQWVSKPVPLVPHVPLGNDRGWDEEDWRAAFDERAGILEFDGGFTRAEAEAMAGKYVEELKARL